MQLEQDRAIPIKIKSKTNIKLSDVRHLRKEIDTEQSSWGIVTSFVDKLDYDSEARLLYVPVWLW